MGRSIGAGALLAAAVAAGGWIGPCWGQQGAAPAPAAAQDAAFEGARRAFEALPEAERRGLQDALVWTGDHTSVASGQFGRATYQAIQAYQRRARLAPSGILDPAAREALKRQGQQAKSAAGFRTVADERTGAQVGVPEAILVKRGANPNGGGRWQSADDKVTLDTRAYAPGEIDLPALFERLTGTSAPGRQITYKVLRPDYLVVAGETAGGRFYIRYAASPAGLRGFSIGYDKGLAAFDKVVVAMGNAFSPVAEAQAAAAAPPGAGAGSPPAPPAAGGGRLVATGLVVAPRRVLTSAAVEACPALRIGNARARVVQADREAGLAVLEAEGGASVPVRLAAGGDGPVVVLAAAGEAPFVAMAGEAVGGRLVAPLQPGAAGAPLFDRRGALAGLVRTYPDAPRLVAGTAPPAAYATVPPAEIARVLAAAGTPPASAAPEAERSTGAIGAAFGRAVVAIRCGP